MARKYNNHHDGDTDSTEEFDSSACDLKQSDVSDLEYQGKKPSIDQEGKKYSSKQRRSQNETDSESNDSEEDVDNMEAVMMKQLSCGWKRNISCKRKRIESYRKFVCSETAKLDSLVFKEKSIRDKMFMNGDKHFEAVLKQWETGTTVSKQTVEKIYNLMTQRQKHYSDIRTLQDRRVSALGKLHQQYIISRGQMSELHDEMYHEAKEKRDEYTRKLFKKFILDKKNEEMANFRKSLESIMFN